MPTYYTHSKIILDENLKFKHTPIHDPYFEKKNQKNAQLRKTTAITDTYSNSEATQITQTTNEKTHEQVHTCIIVIQLFCVISPVPYRFRKRHEKTLVFATEGTRSI